MDCKMLNAFQTCFGQLMFLRDYHWIKDYVKVIFQYHYNLNNLGYYKLNMESTHVKLTLNIYQIIEEKVLILEAEYESH